MGGSKNSQTTHEQALCINGADGGWLHRPLARITSEPFFGPRKPRRTFSNSRRFRKENTARLPERCLRQTRTTSAITAGGDVVLMPQRVPQARQRGHAGHFAFPLALAGGQAETHALIS